MIILCAWCKEKKGEKPPLEDKSITHGICEKCAEIHFDLHTEKKEEVIPVP